MNKVLSTQSTLPGLLCLSHLGWDYVWQRPQHILSRLSQHYPVTYINEPQPSQSSREPYLKLVANEGSLSAWQPLFPDRKEILENWRQLYMGLVQELLLRQGWTRRNGQGIVTTRPLIVWFYTPVPFYFLDDIPADLVIYDVMDELANFKGATADLPAREARLLASSDLVFTGGLSLYQARQNRHPHLHLFRSGVEVEHFAQALDPATEVMSEIARLPKPVLGYFGVIDERIDLELLRQVATAHPDWSIVMVGPVAKIDPETLPRLPNLHYPGQQPYSRLPNFLKGFDVCLMPFAINQATRYISPTKTLEYMAAHKPIVSTPVPEVVTNWSDAVYIAGNPTDYAAAVAAALAETECQRDRRIAGEKAQLALNSWDSIAGQMDDLLSAALERKGIALPEQVARSRPSGWTRRPDAGRYSGL